MQIQPILGYIWAIFRLYQPPGHPPFGISAFHFYISWIRPCFPPLFPDFLLLFTDFLANFLLSLCHCMCKSEYFISNSSLRGTDKVWLMAPLCSDVTRHFQKKEEGLPACCVDEREKSHNSENLYSSVGPCFHWSFANKRCEPMSKGPLSVVTWPDIFDAGKGFVCLLFRWRGIS